METDFLYKEKHALAQALEKKILGDQTKICFADIRSLDLPESLFLSLENQARAIFKTEKPIRIIQSERFRFTDHRLKTELGQLRDLLIGQVYFNATEIRKAIQYCLTLRFDLIVQPFTTISSVLFQSSSERMGRECIEFLNHACDKFHFGKALSDKLLNSAEKKLTRSDLENVLDAVKKQLYGEHPVSSMLFDLEQLQHFYKKVYNQTEIAYAADLIYAMLNDRGMHDFTNGFKKEKQDKPVWRVSEVQQFLERYLLVGQLEQDNNFSSRIVFSDEDYGATDLQPDDKRSQTNPTVPNQLSFRVPPKAKKEATRPSIMHDDEFFGHSFRMKQEYDGSSTDIIKREQIEYQPPGPYPPLHSLIDNKSRNIFIRKIFGKDASAYTTFIEHIDKKESWKEAKALLDTELGARDISPYCREAVKLSDLIFARYFSKGKF